MVPEHLSDRAGCTSCAALDKFLTSLCFYFLMCEIGRTWRLLHWEAGSLQDMKNAELGALPVSFVLVEVLGPGVHFTEDYTEAPRD